MVYPRGPWAMGQIGPSTCFCTTCELWRFLHFLMVSKIERIIIFHATWTFYEIQVLVSINKVMSEHKHTHLLSLTACPPQWQSWVIVTEAAQPAKPEIFTNSSLTEKCAKMVHTINSSWHQLIIMEISSCFSRTLGLTKHFHTHRFYLGLEPSWKGPGPWQIDVASQRDMNSQSQHPNWGHQGSEASKRHSSWRRCSRLLENVGVLSQIEDTAVKFWQSSDPCSVIAALTQNWKRDCSFRMWSLCSITFFFPNYLVSIILLHLRVYHSFTISTHTLRLCNN